MNTWFDGLPFAIPFQDILDNVNSIKESKNKLLELKSSVVSSHNVDLELKRNGKWWKLNLSQKNFKILKFIQNLKFEDSAKLNSTSNDESLTQKNIRIKNSYKTQNSKFQWIEIQHSPFATFRIKISASASNIQRLNDFCWHCLTIKRRKQQTDKLIL